MKVVAAYLLARLGGNESPSPSDLQKICDAAGVSLDKGRAKTVCSAMEGKSFEEVVAAGQEMTA